MTPDRNVAERIIRAVREIMTIVALTLVSILMILVLSAIGAIVARLDGSTTVNVPVPADTTCVGGEC